MDRYGIPTGGGDEKYFSFHVHFRQQVPGLGVGWT